ncbi:MAG: AI-2E family transporter [Actinobacteria bacterium]|nr:AI-2E family transporter [Actinomycetota bacterium]
MEKYKRIALIIWTIIGALIILFSFFYLLSKLKPIFTPILIAIVLTYLLDPIVKFFEKKIARIGSIIIAFSIFFLIIVLFFTSLIPMLIGQFKNFGQKIPDYLKTVEAGLLSYERYYQRVIKTEQLKEILDEITNQLRDFIISIAVKAPEFTTDILKLLFNIFIAILCSFYLLKDRDKLKESLFKIIPAKYSDEISLILRKANNSISIFFKGQLMVALIITVFYFIALSIFRIEFALFLGLVAGLFNIIPYIGPIIGTIPAALVAFFDSPWKALGIIIVFIVINWIEELVIRPKILSQRLGLHPLIIIFALIVGGFLFGMLGLIVAIPIAAFIQELIYHYLLKQERV